MGSPGVDTFADSSDYAPYVDSSDDWWGGGSCDIGIVDDLSLPSGFPYEICGVPIESSAGSFSDAQGLEEAE